MLKPCLFAALLISLATFLTPRVVDASPIVPIDGCQGCAFEGPSYQEDSYVQSFEPLQYVSITASGTDGMCGLVSNPDIGTIGCVGSGCQAIVSITAQDMGAGLTLKDCHGATEKPNRLDCVQPAHVLDASGDFQTSSEDAVKYLACGSGEQFFTAEISTHSVQVVVACSACVQ